jgi:hypothetical protein
VDVDVLGLADAVEADFGDALIDGRLAPEALRTALLRCTRCEQADFCESWLDVTEARKQGGAPAPRAPDFCANIDLMDRLTA